MQIERVVLMFSKIDNIGVLDKAFMFWIKLLRNLRKLKFKLSYEDENLHRIYAAVFMNNFQSFWFAVPVQYFGHKLCKHSSSFIFLTFIQYIWNIWHFPFTFKYRMYLLTCNKYTNSDLLPTSFFFFLLA